MSKFKLIIQGGQTSTSVYNSSDRGGLKAKLCFNSTWRPKANQEAKKY